MFNEESFVTSWRFGLNYKLFLFSFRDNEYDEDDNDFVVGDDEVEPLSSASSASESSENLEQMSRQEYKVVFKVRIPKFLWHFVDPVFQISFQMCPEILSDCPTRTKKYWKYIIQ